MGHKKKLYLIELFLKLAKYHDVSKNIIDFNVSMLKIAHHNIPDNIFKEIQDKYNSDEYIKRITIVIYEYFSEEELQDLINFYSSFVGKKMLNYDFNNKLKTIIENMNQQMDSELCQRKNR